MGIYYGFWNIMLLLPGAIRLLIEVLVVIWFISILWPIDKYIFIILIKIGIGLNHLILGGIRFIMPILSSERKYVWDEKIGKCGSRNDVWLQDKCLKIKESKRKDIIRMKATRLIVFCFYVVSILPFFHLEKYISERYIRCLYTINHFFVQTEAKLTTGIENYPPFWIREEVVETMEVEEEIQEVEQEEEEKEPVYLKLNEGTSYANVRESADIHGERVCVVSNADEILYQDIYEYDSERFWLKVILPSQSNLEGWISANVIEPEIVGDLDLQY